MQYHVILDCIITAPDCTEATILESCCCHLIKYLQLIYMEYIYDAQSSNKLQWLKTGPRPEVLLILRHESKLVKEILKLMIMVQFLPYFFKIVKTLHNLWWFHDFFCPKKSENQEQGKSEGFESCDWPIVRKHPIWVKIGDVLYRVTLKFDGWPWKTIGHLSFAVSSFVQHFIATGEFKLELQSGNA